MQMYSLHLVRKCSALYFQASKSNNCRAVIIKPFPYHIRIIKETSSLLRSCHDQSIKIEYITRIWERYAG